MFRPCVSPGCFVSLGSISIQGEMTVRRANWRRGSRCRSGRKVRQTTAFARVVEKRVFLYVFQCLMNVTVRKETVQKFDP